jgi:hypothetical protein
VRLNDAVERSHTATIINQTKPNHISTSLHARDNRIRHVYPPVHLGIFTGIIDSYVPESRSEFDSCPLGRGNRMTVPHPRSPSFLPATTWISNACLFHRALAQFLTTRRRYRTTNHKLLTPWVHEATVIYSDRCTCHT